MSVRCDCINKVTLANVYWALTMCQKLLCFIRIISFSLGQQLWGNYYFSSSHYKWGNGGTERLDKFPGITWVESPPAALSISPVMQSRWICGPGPEGSVETWKLLVIGVREIVATFPFNLVHLVYNASVRNWKKESVLVQPNPLGIFVRKL